jgi:hypothetical protein
MSVLNQQSSTKNFNQDKINISYMKINKAKLFILLLMTFFAFDQELFAQRQRPTSSRRVTAPPKEASSLKDKLNIEIKLGNPNFSNSIFTLNFKTNVGYKLKSWASAGVGIRPGYTYVNNPSGVNDVSLFDIGAFGYARAKVSNSIYLQAEYGIQSLDNIANAAGPRINFATPQVGGGYMSGVGNWSYGAEVLLNINDVARDQVGVVEYWINFSYKF